MRTCQLVTTSLLFFLLSCKKSSIDSSPHVDFRQEMRNFVQEISTYSHTQKPGFIIIPQNGTELLTNSGDANGIPQSNYISAINGVGREELFYGYNNSNDMSTPATESDKWLALCKVGKNNGLKVLTTDYCFTNYKIQDSYTRNFEHDFISFAATRRELDNIPDTLPYNRNSYDILTLANAKNYLYLINTQSYSSKQTFINDMQATNYDVIIMDAFFQESGNNQIWSAIEIEKLKTKANGGKRLVVAYMSIGEAEDYRWYWQSAWNENKPAWLEE